MGTNVYIHVEMKDNIPGTEKTFYSPFAKISMKRDYYLFFVLAGVRGNSEWNRISSPPTPKGFPEDVCHWVRNVPTYMIDDEYADMDVDGYCTREEALEWVRLGASHFTNEDESVVTDPDVFSVSYMDVDELEEASVQYEKLKNDKSPELRSIIGLLKALNANFVGSRIVFWFK